MAREVKLSIPHELGAEEAKRRIHDGLEALRAEYGTHFSTADIVWSDTNADVKIAAFGQSLTTAIDVADRRVDVTLLLPVLLAGFAERARNFLEAKGSDMLRLPPGSS